SVGHTAGNHKENTLRCNGPQGETRSQKHKPFRFGECVGCLSSVEDPDWSKVQNVQHRGRSGQCRPNAAAGPTPHDRASSRAEKSCQWAGKTHGGASDPCNSEGLPPHVSTESRKEHRHIRRKSAAPNVDVMPHFMHNN